MNNLLYFSRLDARRKKLRKELDRANETIQTSVDGFVKMAAKYCGVPIAFVSMFEGEKERILSKIGFEFNEIAIENSLAFKFLKSTNRLEFNHFNKEYSNANHPLSSVFPVVEYYAVFPIVYDTDITVGTLSICDFKPRALTNEQIEFMELLLKQIADMFEFRLKANNIKKNQDAVYDQKRLAEKLIESLGDGLSINALDGSQLEVNAAFEKMTGFTNDELYGTKPPFKYWPPEEIDTIFEAFSSAQSSERSEFELVFMKKTGERFPVSVSVSTVKDFEGNPDFFYGIVKDITNRKKEENRLKYERDLFSAGPIFSMEWESEVGWPVKYVSENVSKILGYTKEELESNPQLFGSQIHPDDYSKLISGMKSNIRKNATFSDQSYRFKHKLGTYIWLHDFTLINPPNSNSRRRLRGYLYNQTELKLTQDKLIEEKEKLDAIISGTRAGTWEWNIQTGNVIVNERWSELIGLDKNFKQISIDDWFALVHPEDVELSKNAMDRHFSGEIPYYACEIRLKHKKGHYIWIVDKGKVASFTNEGKPLMMYGTHQDISKRKQNEQNINQLLELTKSQNERLMNFAYVVSHNLRSHSFNIQGILQLLEQDYPALNANEYLQLLRVSSENLEQTILHLNDVIQIENIELEDKRVWLNDYVIAAINNVFTLAENAAVEISCKLATDVEIIALPAYLDSIILNLITNAIKYHNPKTKSWVRLESSHTDDYVILSVKDNGLGIDMTKYGHKLFKMHSTFHNNKDAKGIGLFITKNQVEAMQGRIEVESHEGKGSVFKVYFKKAR